MGILKIKQPATPLLEEEIILHLLKELKSGGKKYTWALFL